MIVQSISIRIEKKFMQCSEVDAFIYIILVNKNRLSGKRKSHGIGNVYYDCQYYYYHNYNFLSHRVAGPI